MKKAIAAFAVLTVLFACTPENDPGDGSVHITGISLDRTKVKIMEGESVTLVATVTPDNADNKNVTWTTSSEAIATVDNNGKVTGVKAGSATITATTEDRGKKATCLLTVEANLAPCVTVGSEHVSTLSAMLKGKANLGNTIASDLRIGFLYSKSAGVLPTNSTLVDADNIDSDYSFSNVITGLDPDTKYYFRSFVRQNGQDTYGETKEFTTKALSELLETLDAKNVEATSASLNAKLDLTDVKYSNKAYGFYWGTSESTQNAKLEGGEIKDNAFSAPLTNLSHKTQHWFKAYVILDERTFFGDVKTFTTDVIPVQSISLDKTEYTLNTIGNTLALKATVLPADATDKSITWSSDKEDVAAVDQNGNVKAVGNGTATITVKTKDQEKTAICEITVAQWVTKITISNTSLTLNEGQSANLSVSSISPDNAADKSITWKTSDDKVAKVDNSGKVTAVSKGTATIYAEANDGSKKQAGCYVTVHRLVSSIELSNTSLVIYNGHSATITAKVKPSDASNTSITWASSNPSVATVSSSGKVTGKAKGAATITVTANDGSGVKATCEMEIKQYVTSITLYDTSLSLWVGENSTIRVKSVLPDNANDKTYTWTSSDNSVATVDSNGMVTAKAKGKANIKATANDGSNISATCSVQVDVMPDAVDMGTVVNGKNIKWASFNIGASAPQEYGDYYAWGETQTKSRYSWSTYKFGNSPDIRKYRTYSEYGDYVDNKTVLEAEDDVAHIKLGGKWRMPTEAEWWSLYIDCTWTWVTNYNGTGINGMLVTAHNGNSIFLPASGYCDETYYYAKRGSSGRYWSSSLCTNTNTQVTSYRVRFESGSRNVGTAARYLGYVVRAVSE